MYTNYWPKVTHKVLMGLDPNNIFATYGIMVLQYGPQMYGWIPE